MILGEGSLKVDLFGWFGSLMISAICGYGEKAWRVIASSLAIIFGFGITYFSFGLTNLTPSATYNLETFWRCIYFSVVTFTTLGYGNIYPIGFGETLAMIQSFIGAFMIALFVIVFGRKFMR